MPFPYFKALHIIFVVTWFAGLFYIVRLFIYQTEALNKTEAEQKILNPQLALMARRLWLGITWPSAILTLILGTSMLLKQPFWLKAGFMHLKLGLVFLLYAYHLYCHFLYKKLQKGVKALSSNQLRLWNELATLFLVAIVFLIVLKNSLDMLWGLLGLLIFAIVLMLAIRIYRNIREKK